MIRSFLKFISALGLVVRNEWWNGKKLWLTVGKEKVKSILGIGRNLFTGENTLELAEMNETGQNRPEFGPR